MQFLDQVADAPVVVQRPVPMVQSVQLPVVSTVAVHRQGRRHPRRGAEAVDTCSCVSVHSAMLGLRWYRPCVSHGSSLCEFPTVSCAKWTPDPEVDSRPILLVASPEEHRYLGFFGR